MMRSLYSGVAGLKTHQTKMDVIGNNIANVNTVAYKSQSVTFSELMYQTTQSASGANAETGRAGTNAKQIGLGVKNGAISTAITTSGSSQNTGNPFDIQINGDSFFIVSDGANTFFTRAGTFNIDANGTLCMTTNGFTVQGWQADDTGAIIKNTVSPLNLMSADKLISPAEATTEGYMTGIIDKNDDQLASTGGQITTLQFYDAKGYSYTIKFSVTETATEGEYNMVPTDVLDAKGKSILSEGVTDAGGTVTGAVALEDIFDAGTLAGFTLGYDTATGKFTGATPAGGGTADAEGIEIVFNKSGNGITDAFADSIDVSLKNTKNIDNKGTTTLAGRSGNVENTALHAGHAAGEMSTLAVQTDGKILATYTNGVTRVLGQIAVATFANAAGLEKRGDNLYASTANSGDFDGVGVDITADGGSMTSGVLEMSNVDLSSEFTEMITTQRGFQANSRIITVSDTLLEELVNLKR